MNDVELRVFFIAKVSILQEHAIIFHAVVDVMPVHLDMSPNYEYTINDTDSKSNVIKHQTIEICK
jgi:hypothetical protein